MQKSPLLIIGPGAWGTALALTAARNGNEVHLWGNIREEMQQIINERENKITLPGYKFPDTLIPYMELDDAIDGVRDILIVTPSQAFPRVIAQLKPYHEKNKLRIAWGTKGLHQETKQLLHTWLLEQMPGIAIAVMAGPSFAEETARECPTALNIAYNDKDFCDRLCSTFNNENFGLLPTTDLVGVQLGSVVKNVLAVATGINDGLQLGSNARSALMTLGLKGMNKLNLTLGGRAETLSDLAGLGDLVLTCTDDQSRNRSFGLALGRGLSIDEAFKKVGHTVEGWANVKQLFQLAKDHGVVTPIIERVYAVLYEGADPKSITHNLIKLISSN